MMANGTAKQMGRALLVIPKNGRKVSRLAYKKGARRKREPFYTVNGWPSRNKATPAPSPMRPKRAVRCRSVMTGKGKREKVVSSSTWRRDTEEKKGGGLSIR